MQLFEHFHFGAGRGGLGAILPASIEAGGSLHVVAHPATSLPPGCELVCHICSGEAPSKEQPLELASLSIADAIGQLKDAARAVLVTAPSLLITTTLSPDGILAQSKFLLSLADARKGRHTILILCEYEQFGEDHAELREHLARLGVDVRQGVVSRLCNVAAPLGDRRRAVRADRQVHWYIEGRPDCPLLQALERSGGVCFSDHIEQHRLRTRWLAYGMHLSLALLASERKQMELSAQAADLAREHWIDRVLLMFVELVQARCPDLQDTYDYAQSQVEALLRHKQDGTAALRNLRRASPLSFLRELESSIVEPWSEIVASGGVQLPPEALRLFFALEVVLCDVARYSDIKLYEKGQMVLDAQRDGQMSDVYRRMLERVFPAEPTEVEGRVIALEVALDLHRDELDEAD